MRLGPPARRVLFVALTVLFVWLGAVTLRRSENSSETWALSMLKVISSSEIAYSASCGNGGYAASLDTLMKAPPGGQPFLPPDRADSAMSETHGYTVTLGADARATAGPIDCHGRATSTGFFVTAVPIVVESTGSTSMSSPPRRAFGMSAEGAIWQRLDGVAPVEPFGPPATPIR